MVCKFRAKYEPRRFSNAVGQQTFPDVRVVPRIAHRLFAVSSFEKKAYRSANAG